MTHSRLVTRLRALGLGGPGAETVLVHTRMSALGWVVGGAPVVVASLLDALGPRGTLLVLTGWDDRPPYHQAHWPDEERKAYRDACPPFDPRTSRAEREFGRVPEAVRTWPGARHSYHPICAFAAVGARAAELVGGQSLDEGFGAASPLERLVEADGAVLLLGAPLDTVTLLHYAEYRAAVAEKRWLETEMPVLVSGQRIWRRIRELDSDLGAFPYEELDLDEDAFAVITREVLAYGTGRSGAVGAAVAHLLPARSLVDHAIAWMESRFGDASAQR